MSRDRLLTLFSSLLGIIGALFMAKGIFGMSPDVMAKLSSTYIGFNQFDVENLASQKADLLVGLILVLIAFGVSMLSFLFPDPESLSKIIGSYWHTFICAIFISLLIAGLAYWANYELRLRFALETQQVLFKHNLASALNYRQIYPQNFDYYRKNAENFLGITMKPNESERDFILCLAKALKVESTKTVPKQEDSSYIDLTPPPDDRSNEENIPEKQ